MFPFVGSTTRHLLSSAGFPEPGFPWFHGTMRCSDFLPSVSPRFVAFAWRYHSSARISPAVRPSAAAGESSGVGHPVSPAGTLVSGNGRISCVPGEPRLCSCPALRPRRDRRIRPCNALARPPLCPRRRLPRFVLSRLNHTASALAVYASQCRLPQHHARLASGCWPDSSGRA